MAEEIPLEQIPPEARRLLCFGFGYSAAALARRLSAFGAGLAGGGHDASA